MSGNGGNSDEDDDENSVVVRPKSLWARFLKGDKRAALLCVGVFAGSVLSAGLFSGHMTVHYNTAPSGIRHLFWLGMSAFALWLVVQPGKAFGRSRISLGELPMDESGDWFRLGAIIVATFAVSWVIVRWT
jgi:hypothetical protein